jgi:hypothetical protein
MKRLFLIFTVMLMASFARAQWEEDVRLTFANDTSDLSFGMSHNIAASGDTVHVVWEEQNLGSSEIYYKRSTDGGLSWDWQHDTRISYAEGYSYYPCIALSGPLIHLVWSDTRGGDREIYYIRSIDGGESWEEETRLTDDPAKSYEAVVASSGSNVHVAWVKTEFNLIWQILYKHSPDGGITWEPEVCLSGSSVDAYNPTIAVSGSDIYVAWNDKRDGNIEIYYIKSTDNGLNWEPEIRLTDDPADSGLPSIAVSGSNVHVVWTDSRNGLNEVFYKGSVDGGENWGDDIPLHFDPVFSVYPNLAVSNSVIHVVWIEFYGVYFSVFYTYSTDGGDTWAAKTHLNEYECNTEFPSIAVAGTLLHVVWKDFRDANYEIYYKRNPTGGIPVGLQNEPPDGFGTQFSIHQNPASRQLTVDSWQLAVPSSQFPVGGRQSSVRLSIVDLYGREIKAFANISSFPCRVDISDLPNGLYFLEVGNEEGKSGSTRFLKVEE